MRAGVRAEDGEKGEEAEKPSMISVLIKTVLKNPYIWGMALTYFFIYVIRQGVTSWCALPRPLRHSAAEMMACLSSRNSGCVLLGGPPRSSNHGLDHGSAIWGHSMVSHPVEATVALLRDEPPRHGLAAAVGPASAGQLRAVCAVCCVPERPAGGAGRCSTCSR